MGDGDTCTDGLVGTERERFILSFGEDEAGELYVLTTSRARPTMRSGVVYRIIDPSRSVPYQHTAINSFSAIQKNIYKSPSLLYYTYMTLCIHAGGLPLELAE